jgi:hypothetical protein
MSPDDAIEILRHEAERGLHDLQLVDTFVNQVIRAGEQSTGAETSDDVPTVSGH